MSNKMHIKLNVNGKDEEFLAEPRELLIYTLRERLNITGPHIGCETSLSQLMVNQ
jgi:carbon-monoxide dehydrogenase small subunit